MPSDVKDRVLAREQADWHGVSGNMPENLRSNIDTLPTSSHNAAVKVKKEEKRRGVRGEEEREKKRKRGKRRKEKKRENFSSDFPLGSR